MATANVQGDKYEVNYWIEKEKIPNQLDRNLNKTAIKSIEGSREKKKTTTIYLRDMV